MSGSGRERYCRGLLTPRTTQKKKKSNSRSCQNRVCRACKGASLHHFRRQKTENTSVQNRQPGTNCMHRPDHITKVAARQRKYYKTGGNTSSCPSPKNQCRPTPEALPSSLPTTQCINSQQARRTIRTCSGESLKRVLSCAEMLKASIVTSRELAHCWSPAETAVCEHPNCAPSRWAASSLSSSLAARRRDFQFISCISTHAQRLLLFVSVLTMYRCTMPNIGSGGQQLHDVYVGTISMYIHTPHGSERGRGRATYVSCDTGTYVRGR